VGNLLRVSETLKEDFTAEDVEIYLQEHNCLPPDVEKEDLLSAGSRKILGTCASKESSDSD
jgi:hypothetical protein